jgi:enoyl-CoA hydratase/carnithine racemase
VLPPSPELDGVLAGVKANPLASLALVQLLRLAEGLSLRDAILAESLVYATLQAGPEFAAWLASRERRPPDPGNETPVAVSRQGDTLMLRLDRPQKRNAFSAAMRDALCEALHLALQDESIGGIGLSGAGPSFCSGGDLDEFGTLPDPATAHAIRSIRSPALLLARCGPRTRVRVHGACIGAGAELPAFCAHVSAAPDAFFRLPEVAMGLVPGAGGTASLPRRIGRQRSAELALSGRPLDAETALRWGLVDEVRR